MKVDILKNATGLVKRAGFQMKKYSPEILIVAGVVGTVASAVMACRATTKIGTILDETKDTIDTIHHCADAEETTIEYTQEDAKKDLTTVYVHTGVRLVKLYAPAVALGALSITSILASNDILRKRNVALGAAYAAVDKSFKEYRSRVVERYGNAVDRELRYNIRAKEFEEKVVDETTGEETTLLNKVDVADPDTTSDFAKFFDESSRYWEKNAEYNLTFLRAQQNYANDLLRANGHLFLNEVYDMLDIPRTKAGQIVGWVYDPEHPLGDNYVDFGIYDVNREKKRDFVNGYEKAILLDFNVDGNILDMM